MALGGGVFVTTDSKLLPGAYINVVSASKVTSTVGERGVVAIALPLAKATAGQVVVCSRQQFVTNPDTILGTDVPESSLIALREIFKHAVKVYIYNSIVILDDDEDGFDPVSAPTVSQICNALEPYDFNIICAYTNVQNDVNTYISAVTTWRNDIGKKCQAVVFNVTNSAPNNEGIINVVSTVSDTGAVPYALLPWVAGAEAGCAVNSSCTNMLYDGEYNIIVDKTQEQLEECLQNGQFVFHRVYDKIRTLEDINSLTETTADKGEDFKNNQTIRVVDQIANDIAKLFNTKYLGKIPNNASGRVSLWADIVNHHRQLETIQAIENFDANLVTVQQGQKKKSVIVNDVVQPVNAMAQLYMTVVIE